MVNYYGREQWSESVAGLDGILVAWYFIVFYLKISSNQSPPLEWRPSKTGLFAGLFLKKNRFLPVEIINKQE